jgi:hypothetical protein
MSVGDPESLPHAYTNLVTAREHLVTKTYRGADGVERQQREVLAIRSLRGILPVATIVDSQPGVVVLDRVAGRHGQDLIGAGQGHAVMSCLGRLLRAVQATPPTFYDEFEGTGVLVHGDFGPNNVLLADDADEIVLLADWEWSTIGVPVTDLAWVEFILRMHHPDHLECLPDLFDGYGERPPWSERQTAMADRAASLEAWVRTSRGGEAASTWDYRSRCIAQWDEV